jgi:hypothetical protein
MKGWYTTFLVIRTALYTGTARPTITDAGSLAMGFDRQHAVTDTQIGLLEGLPLF